MATETDLINHTLSILGKPGAGQSVAAEDFELLRPMVQNMLDDLSERGVVHIGDKDNFEGKYLHWLALYFASGYFAKPFGEPIDKGAMDFAETMLRKLNVDRMTPDPPPRAQYF